MNRKIAILAASGMLTGSTIMTLGRIVATFGLLFMLPLAASTQGVSSGEDPFVSASKKSFGKARQLLLEFGLPFEPNDLLDPKARKGVIRKLEELGHLRQSEVIPGSVRGVKIADTLYMPKRTTLDGDTVLIARFIVFEESDVLIKGPHDLTVLPFDDIGHLGTSYTRAGLIPAHSQINAFFTGSNSPPNFASTGIALRNGGNLKIDLRGFGREDWERRDKYCRQFNDSLKTLIGYQAIRFETAFAWKMSSLSCTPGTEGAPGADQQGQAATGNPGDSKNPGAGGTCSGNINGGGGDRGDNAGTGVTGLDGGNGGDAGHAGSCNLYVPDNNPTLNLSIDARGGIGGRGGTGQTGGTGGTGGDGGDGGDGASCACNVGLGTGGTGGTGGTAGRGGDGGKGGKGGKGGNGGAVTVSLPYNYSGSKGTPLYGSGQGGTAGLGGTQGAPGVPGNKGEGGDGGSNISCSPNKANDGSDGSDGTSNGYGGTGGSLGPGDPGTTPGSYSETYRSPCVENGCSCSPLNHIC